MKCDLLESIDSLIAKAEAVRARSWKEPERNAELLHQHADLLKALKTLRGYVDGQAMITSALSERVNALASLYFETAPGQWLIRPAKASRFRGALWRLLDLVRDMQSS